MEILLYVVIALLVIVIILIAISLSRPKGAASGSNAAVEGELRSQIGEQKARVDALVSELEKARLGENEARLRLQTELTKYQELKSAFDDAQVKLKDAFASLSTEALKGNRDEFMLMASKELDTRKQAIDNELKRLSESIALHSDKASALDAQLKSAALAEQTLAQETRGLVNALRRPEVRGSWGEITLQRTMELAGMSRHCDFAVQQSVSTEKGHRRPDMVVKLPSGREIVVDAKTPLDAYLNALEAPNEEIREAALTEHTKQVKKAVAELSSKEYKEQFATADFVVMFLPGDVFLDAAATRDPKLIEDAMAKGVVIATPSTLLALLKAVAMGWKEERLAENARRIAEEGAALYKAFQVLSSHITELGKNLEKATKAYNELIGSADKTLYFSAKRLRDAAQCSLPEVSDPTLIELAVRESSRFLPEAEAEPPSLPTEETR